MTQTLSKVVIIGRPNVGKSTLFNRLVGKKLALVHDLPGVTRDRREAAARLGDLRFNIIDTAGLDDAETDDLAKGMLKQTEQAIKESDIILFVYDAREGIVPLDKYFADMVRRSGKHIVLLANKCEGKLAEQQVYEYATLGLGTPIGISAEHGEGLVDLYDALKNHINDSTVNPDADNTPPLQLAIIGRPNVGKSTMINRLINEDRLITADMPGVTRDSIAVDWEYKGRKLKLIDTAGMRRRSKVDDKLETLSVLDGLRAVNYAQVVILVLDHDTPLAKQDTTIANRVIDEGRVLIIAINKWDLVENKKEFMADIEHKLSHVLPQVKGVPCIPISAKTGKNLEYLLDESFKVYDKWNSKIPTSALNNWLANIVSFHPPPIVGKGRIKMKYITQIKMRPPTFKIFTSKASEVPSTYIKYLVNSLRDDFDLPGVPIRVEVKSSKNPYVDD